MGATVLDVSNSILSAIQDGKPIDPAEAEFLARAFIEICTPPPAPEPVCSNCQFRGSEGAYPPTDGCYHPWLGSDSGVLYCDGHRTDGKCPCWKLWIEPLRGYIFEEGGYHSWRPDDDLGYIEAKYRRVGIVGPWEEHGPGLWRRPVKLLSKDEAYQQMEASRIVDEEKSRRLRANIAAMPVFSRRDPIEYDPSLHRSGVETDSEDEDDYQD